MLEQRSVCAFVLCALTFSGSDGARPASLKSKKMAYPRDGNVRTLIEGLGYMYESYNVTTEDGYILNLNRMVNPKMANRRNRGAAVLLVHGLFMHSEAWLFQALENNNIAGTWAKKGYDVWLGDQRGSLRSMRHVNYTTQQKEFWDFSFHETGIYDLPAFVDFILKKTGNQKIIYSCMSLGCAFHFVLLAEKPEYNEKFLGGIDFVPIGPVPKKSDLPSSTRVTLIFLELLLNSYEKQDVISVRNVDLLKKELRRFCGYNPAIFSLMVQFFIGRGQYFDTNYLCSQAGLGIGGTSLKTIEHFLQLFEYGEFAQYNYGREENLKRYGKELPPMYDLGKITSFVAIYGTENDVFTPPNKVDQMLKELGGPTYRCVIANFNHIDVSIGVSFNHILPDVSELLDSISGYSNDTSKASSFVCPSGIGNWIYEMNQKFGR